MCSRTSSDRDPGAHWHCTGVRCHDEHSGSRALAVARRRVSLSLSDPGPTSRPAGGRLGS
eukprot:1105497-Rhodomonas_salina.2